MHQNIRFRFCTMRFVFLLLLASCAATAEKQEPPEPKPLGKVEFPAYQKKVLPNGLIVYALEYHEQPIVALRLIIAAGAVHDPQNLPGVAAFTADLLSRGTRKRSANEIAGAIDYVGGSLETSADMESTTIAATVLTDSVGVAFELMHDVLLNPVFAPDELMRVQQQSMSSLAADMEESEFIADAVFDRIIYGSHPYGHIQGGTLQSIPRIKHDDLVSFHNRHYAPNNAALAIAGDLSTTDAFKLAEQWFGSWPKKEISEPERHTVPNLEGRRLVIVDKPDSVQTEIRVGHPTIPRKDPDYFNVLIGSHILGGSASGRLNRSLRVERGLTYGAFATIRPKKGPSGFYLTTETRTEKTTEALKLVFDELQKLASAEVPADELQNAKSFIIGSFPLTIEIPSDLATRLTTVFLYDLGDDYLKTFRDRLAAVTADQVLRVAKEKISTANTAAVLVGKAGDFKGQLAEFGKEEIIPIGELDLDSPNLRKR